MIARRARRRPARSAGSDDFVDAATLDTRRARCRSARLIVSSIALINLLVLVFNLIPAYPLDGGRIARAAVWKVTGDRNKATRAAAGVGRGFAWLLIGWRAVPARQGEAFNGIYLAVLGWLLGPRRAASRSQTAFTERLEGVTVADLMDAEPVTIPADPPALRAYEDFFLRYHGYEWFAVVEADGRYVGRAVRSRPVPPRAANDADRPCASSSSPAATVASARTRRSRRCWPPSRCAAAAR